MNRFNVRVYGILINDNKEILVLDEVRNGLYFTKFPGGGLEWGEGIHSCLKREFIEELDLEVQVGELFFINDHFIPSLFNPLDQLISIYYFVNLTISKLVIKKTENEFPRWIAIDKLNEEDLFFPIDKLVLIKLKKEII